MSSSQEVKKFGSCAVLLAELKHSLNIGVGSTCRNAENQDAYNLIWATLAELEHHADFIQGNFLAGSSSEQDKAIYLQQQQLFSIVDVIYYLVIILGHHKSASMTLSPEWKIVYAAMNATVINGRGLRIQSNSINQLTFALELEKNAEQENTRIADDLGVNQISSQNLRQRIDLRIDEMINYLPEIDFGCEQIKTLRRIFADSLLSTSDHSIKQQLIDMRIELMTTKQFPEISFKSGLIHALRRLLDIKLDVRFLRVNKSTKIVEPLRAAKTHKQNIILVGDFFVENTTVSVSSAGKIWSQNKSQARDVTRNSNESLRQMLAATIPIVAHESGEG